MRLRLSRLSVSFLFLFLCFVCTAQTNFTVGTYNLERYFSEDTPEFTAKQEKIVEIICKMNVDVLGLAEIGTYEEVLQLIRLLKKEGINYADYVWMRGNDGNSNLAILSRYPLENTIEHKKDKYLLAGKRYLMKRGILETTARFRDDYTCTFFLTHLKSKLQSSKVVNANDVRLEEAQILRQKADAVLAENAASDFILMGDFNDDYSSKTLREIIGNKTGQTRLLDTRPMEPNGDGRPERIGSRSRNVVWTHFYASEDSYSRFDYILISPGLKDQFIPEDALIVTVPNWGIASDHRAIKSGFSIPSKVLEKERGKKSKSSKKQ